ncbi:MAG: OprD family outer membrane porin [Chitinophagaceae bacterium]|nr:OprD family outer membrane porin [Chitinophagaceae bacterium]
MLESNLYAQHQELLEKPETWKGKKSKEFIDSTSILSAFKHGHFSGHFRSFSMATNNANQLTDYYANAIGGGLKFETANFHHVQFGVSGFYVFNMASSDFSKPDSSSNQLNRYELALFEIPNPSNRVNLSRLEELYLKYNFKSSHVTLGRQLINTPFINLQDGRMRPTEVMGIWAEIKSIKHTKIEGGVLNKISPRSTLEYYNIGESIGIYSTGVNIDGSKSNYKNHVSSRFVGILGLTHQVNTNLKLQCWNQYAENIFNTSILQSEYTYTMKNKSKLLIGIQGIFQTAVNDGGNIEATKTYINKNAKAFTYGAKIALINRKLEASFNYNRITSTGRYLMPREWGRDPFFTFMPRERNEGFGDVHAYVVRLNYLFPSIKLKTNLSVGYVDLPEITNYRLNKYGMPSYGQINLDIRYKFSNFLQGLDAQFLLAHKINATREEQPKTLFNKVDMTNYNFILNFHF